MNHIFFKKEVLVNEIPLEIKTNPVNIYAENMIDKNIETYAEFSLDSNNLNQDNQQKNQQKKG